MSSDLMNMTASNVIQKASNVGRRAASKAVEYGTSAKDYLGEKIFGHGVEDDDDDVQSGGGSRRRRAPRSLKSYRVGDKLQVGKKMYMVGLRDGKKVLYPYSNRMELAVKLHILNKKGRSTDKKRVAKALTALFMADNGLGF